MKSIIRTTIFAGAFSVLGGIAALGGQAVAGHGYGAMGGGNCMGGHCYGQGTMNGSNCMAGRMAAIADDLQLDDEQEAALQGIRSSLLQQFQSQAGDTVSMPRLLAQAIESNNADAVHAALDSHISWRAELMHDLIDQVMTFSRSLDDGQRTMLEDGLESFQGGCGWGWGMGWGWKN